MGPRKWDKNKGKEVIPNKGKRGRYVLAIIKNVGAKGFSGKE
jgi:hypothetical protein